ncbi:hypothetical protein DERP_003204 [Dermatophagoides pteronyssinus]|uniref:Uncharacterized protein n=1 Tax=Dermatophagoides pteronyssinus TaxID=6956 RepID=A0ABQ8JIX2_DERPT|nr:hypothetical protein DERP_003204 [Dermatophagoides pteronyssinus]
MDVIQFQLEQQQQKFGAFDSNVYKNPNINNNISSVSTQSVLSISKTINALHSSATSIARFKRKRPPLLPLLPPPPPRFRLPDNGFNDPNDGERLPLLDDFPCLRLL